MHTRSESTYFGTAVEQRVFIEYTPCAIPAPLIILLHGLGGSTNYFQPLVQDLSLTNPLLRIDLPCQGRSALRPSLKFADYVTLLHSIIQAKSPSAPVILIGHSMGSIISMHYACQYPSAACGLVLIGPGTASPGGPAHLARLASVARNGTEFMMDSTVENNVAANCSGVVRAFVREVIAAQRGEGYARTCEAMAGQTNPAYGRITCETVVVAGDEDRISSLETAEWVTREIERGEAKVELVVVKAGHQHVLEDTEGVLGAVRGLLERLTV